MPRTYLNVSFHHPEQRVNISVVADKILVRGHGGTGGRLVFLSVLGPHSAVRGILAAAVTQREIRCDSLPGGYSALGDGGRIMTHALTKESRIVHGIFLGPEFSTAPDRTGDRAVLDPTPDKVVEVLKRTFPVPALPEWNGWIYDALKKADLVQPLTGKGATGCLVSVWEDRLDQIISQGVKTGAIRF